MNPLMFDPAALIIAALVYILALIAAVRWPSVGIGLVLSIIVIKALVQMRVGPILQDYTFDMGMVVLAIVGASVHRLRHGGPMPIPPPLIVAWFVIVMLMWVLIPISRNPEYGYKKALIFSIFNTLAVASVALYMVSAHEARALFRVVVIGGVLVSLAMPLYGGALAQYEGARQTLGLANPLGIADFASWTLLILIVGLIQFGGVARLVGLLIFAPLTVVAIYLTQTRFPLIAVPPVLVVVFWMYRRRVNFRVAALSAVGLGLAALITSVFIDPAHGGSRFTPQAFREGMTARQEMARIAWHGLLRSPVLGNGTGDSSYQISGGDATFQGYPHNALLEIANELGVLGAAAWIMIIGYALWVGWEFRRYALLVTGETYYALVASYAIYLYLVLASFKTGAYFYSPAMYMFAAQLIALHAALRHQLATHRPLDPLHAPPVSAAPAVTTGGAAC